MYLSLSIYIYICIYVYIYIYIYVCTHTFCTHLVFVLLTHLCAEERTLTVSGL